LTGDVGRDRGDAGRALLFLLICSGRSLAFAAVLARLSRTTHRPAGLALRHDHIREKQIRPRSAFNDANGLARAAGFDRGAAELALHFGAHRALAI
jgi:hypothetical protein